MFQSAPTGRKMIQRILIDSWVDADFDGTNGAPQWRRFRSKFVGKFGFFQDEWDLHNWTNGVEWAQCQTGRFFIHFRWIWLRICEIGSDGMFFHNRWFLRIGRNGIEWARCQNDQFFIHFRRVRLRKCEIVSDVTFFHNKLFLRIERNGIEWA